MTQRPSEDETSRREVEAVLLAYLHRHPQAADTLEGIVSWWLPQQRYEVGSQRIERVLRDMVDSGTLRCERLPGGAVLYALNPSPEPPAH